MNRFPFLHVSIAERLGSRHVVDLRGHILLTVAPQGLGGGVALGQGLSGLLIRVIFVPRISNTLSESLSGSVMVSPVRRA